MTAHNNKILGEGLTYDDVLLVPAYSEVLPREVSISTKFTRNISLNVPVLSAAMDTVTESAMAMSIAREGGIGVLHKNMSIKDAMSILKGNDKAATIYLKEQTSKDLYVKFKPVVKKSIEKVKLTKYWNTLSGRYNALPMTSNVNPDLEDYVTTKAINGLFLLIAKEEKSIRNNPKARVSEILQKVFK